MWCLSTQMEAYAKTVFSLVQFTNTESSTYMERICTDGFAWVHIATWKTKLPPFENVKKVPWLWLIRERQGLNNRARSTAKCFTSMRAAVSSSHAYTTPMLRWTIESEYGERLRWIKVQRKSQSQWFTTRLLPSADPFVSESQFYFWRGKDSFRSRWTQTVSRRQTPCRWRARPWRCCSPSHRCNWQRETE